MPNGTYGGVRGRKTKVGEKLLRFPPTRLTGEALLEKIGMSKAEFARDKRWKIIINQEIDIDEI